MSFTIFNAGVALNSIRKRMSAITGAPLRFFEITKLLHYQPGEQFSNTDPAGAPDYATLHAGLPPTTGEKWLLSQWIRSKPVAG